MNWMKAGPYTLINSIADDGGICISKDDKILWSIDVPEPLIEEWTGAEIAHGLTHPTNEPPVKPIGTPMKDEARKTLYHTGYGTTHAFTIPLLGQLAVVEALEALTAEVQRLQQALAKAGEAK